MAKSTVSKSDIKRAVYSGPLIDASAFNSAKGQKVAGGGNVLVLPPNKGAGPFTITAITEKTLHKKYKPVNVWTGADAAGTEWSLPAATSFVQKATEAKLAVGETVLIFRNDDYRANGKDCASYAINITSRAKGAKA
jgi:hypothetical protein